MSDSEVSRVSNCIQDGKYVFVRRGDMERIIMFKSSDTIRMGKGDNIHEIQLKGAEGGELVYSKFKVVLSTVPATLTSSNGTSSVHGGKKGRKSVHSKQYILEPLEDVDSSSSSESDDEEEVTDVEGRRDNRKIFDDNKSQCLRSGDIAALRDAGVAGPAILDTLIAKSKSFELKTDFAREKYLKKKEKVHGDTICFMKPSLDVIIDFHSKKDASKIGYLNLETISQMISHGGVTSGGNFIVYETGCSGLLVAAVMERLAGSGLCLHVHSGSTPQRQAVAYMNFSSKELETLKSLDVYYLSGLSYEDLRKKSMLSSDNGNTTGYDNDSLLQSEPKPKRRKEENTDANEESTPSQLQMNVKISDLDTINKGVTRKDNERNAALLHSSRFDGLLICAKEHPLTLLQRLFPCLSLANPFVIFCENTEPLADCYQWLKDSNRGTDLHIYENFSRDIVVDTNRTHPDINMNCSGGFILTGSKVHHENV